MKKERSLQQERYAEALSVYNDDEIKLIEHAFGRLSDKTMTYDNLIVLEEILKVIRERGK